MSVQQSRLSEELAQAECSRRRERKAGAGLFLCRATVGLGQGVAGRACMRQFGLL